ncbi:hypothetical protein [Streptomyces capparidis]
MSVSHHISRIFEKSALPAKSRSPERWRPPVGDDVELVPATVLTADPRSTHYVAVPPVSHDDGPRTHWKVPVTSRHLTRSSVLLAALRTATRTVLP